MVDEKYSQDLKHFAKRSKSWSEGSNRRCGLRYWFSDDRMIKKNSVCTAFLPSPLGYSKLLAFCKPHAYTMWHVRDTRKWVITKAVLSDSQLAASYCNFIRYASGFLLSCTTPCISLFLYLYLCSIYISTCSRALEELVVSPAPYSRECSER